MSDYIGPELKNAWRALDFWWLHLLMYKIGITTFSPRCIRGLELWIEGNIVTYNRSLPDMERNRVEEYLMDSTGI